MSIKPLDLPTAAGVDYGLGDVRHFAEDDAVAVPGLQNPTRHLAQRDNLLSAKHNEVISTVNNREQFVPLPIVRTSVVPGTEEAVTNFKIPSGFEARVLYAAIASSPASSDLTLKVFYNESFGGATGTELLSVTDEFASGTAFYNAGEFVVTIRNNGASLLEAITSITLTVRPIGERGSLLVGSVIQGEKGDRGEKGTKGDKGDPGAGAASITLTWKDDFQLATAYVPGDLVLWTVSSGGTGSVYRNKLACTGVLPSVSANWDLFVEGGVSGTGLTFVGSYTSGTWPGAYAWAVNDVVAYDDGTKTDTYICILAGTSAVPPSATSNWTLIASGASGAGGETPVYAHNTLVTCTYASTATSSASGDYEAVASSGSFQVDEYSIVNTTGTIKGLAWLVGSVLINLPAGAVVTVTLPTSILTTAQYQNWTGTGTAHLVAAPQGSRTLESGTTVHTLNVAYPSTTTVTLTSLAAADTHTNLLFFGVQQKT